MDDIASIPMRYGWPEWGLLALSLAALLAVVTALVRGGLMARRTVDLLLAEKDQLVAYHAATAETRRLAIDLKDQQIGALLDGMKTVESVMQSLREAAKADGT